MLLNVGWNVVFITSDVTFTGRKVLIMVVFGLKNAFYLGNRSIELQPLLVDRLRDTFRLDTSAI